MAAPDGEADQRCIAACVLRQALGISQRVIFAIGSLPVNVARGVATAIQIVGLRLWPLALEPRRLPDETTEPLVQQGPIEAGDVSPQRLASLLGNLPPNNALQEDGHTKGPPISCDWLDVLASCDSSAQAKRIVDSIGSDDINATDALGRSALLLAAAEGHVEACRSLLQRPDYQMIDWRNSIGCTALHIAAGNDEREICQMLLDCPRFTWSVNCKNDNGQTPLDFAIAFGEGHAASDVLALAGGKEASGGRSKARERRYGDELAPKNAAMDALD
mmetsp:Transcript_59089/g.132346  ORF Transcript_59089/g.132346 Transcript_59089/m.132346 type:complete len:275 (+) Transcript_59089:81-905(+)